MKRLIVSIDTEIDADPYWRISTPPAFTSITKGVPDVFTPLFERYGVRPTYLLSPEIIEDEECVEVLKRLGPEVELGTHLHAEFIEPERSLFTHNMAGKHHNALQRQYEPQVEREKLRNLTKAFERAFGYKPLSHRAGRFGRSEHTLGFLAGLGYKVDSSVTPGVLWELEEGRLDYRKNLDVPSWVKTSEGSILDLPVSIRPGSGLAPYFRDIRPLRPLSRLLGRVSRYEWLRPGYSSASDMIRFAQESPNEILVLMMHSVEVIPGASPLSNTPERTKNIIDALDALFESCRSSGIGFCKMSESAELVPVA